MNTVEKKVVISVRRNANYKPFATIYYQNGTELQAPNQFDKPTAFFANYIAKKTVTNEIKGVIYSYDQKGIVDRFDISPITDDNYCIIGSDPGRKPLTDVIKRVTEASSLPEISTPVYLTDNNHSVVMNDEILRRNNDMPPITKEELDQKYQIIESIITEDKEKVLKKAA